MSLLYVLTDLFVYFQSDLIVHNLSFLVFLQIKNRLHLMSPLAHLSIHKISIDRLKNQHKLPNLHHKLFSLYIPNLFLLFIEIIYIFFLIFPTNFDVLKKRNLPPCMGSKSFSLKIYLSLTQYS